MSGKDALTDKVITDKWIYEIYPQIRLGVRAFERISKNPMNNFRHTWTMKYCPV